MKKKSNKKILFLSCLICVLFFISLTNTQTTAYDNNVNLSSEEDPFVFGILGGNINLDPVHAWDTNSFSVILQSVECLFSHDTTKSPMEITPLLAASHGVWSSDKLIYTVNLRTGVRFHDGTELDASVVKWNFDRVAYFMNVTGEIWDSGRIAPWEDLFRLDDGRPIINRTEVVNSYEIRFVLNEPFSALESLLAFPGTGILSPSSTPFSGYIVISTADLVGTGPFDYINYEQDLEINYHQFTDYWGQNTRISHLKFSLYEGSSLLNEALLNGEIDMIDQVLNTYLTQYEEHPDISLVKYNSSIIRQIALNNKRINSTWRRAISYSVNYDEIINNAPIRGIKMNSPFANIMQYYNDTLDFPIFNITKSREILHSAGIGLNLGLYDDNAWIQKADSGSPLSTLNITFPIGNEFQENVSYMLEENLKLIGIDLIPIGLTWSEYINILFNLDQGWDAIGLAFTGWGLDINHPYGLYELYKSNGDYNMAQIDDSYINSLLDAALNTTDEDELESIYNEVQRYLVEESNPYIWLYQQCDYFAFKSNVYDLEYTLFGTPLFKNTYRGSKEPPEPNTYYEFIHGCAYGPTDIDPHKAYDTGSMNIINQVVESLFEYNLSDPNLELIPRLAADDGSWSNDKLNFTVNLRTDVKFHDGTDFNADAVKWNYERLSYFMNSSGDLPEYMSSPTFKSLYMWEDGTPIIKEIEVLGEHKVKFILNRPMAAFEALLSFSGSAILSPSSTPRFEYIDVNYGELVGTGPFVYENYDSGNEIIYSAWENYYHGKAEIDKLIYRIIPDINERNNALLNGEIDFLSAPSIEFLADFADNPGIHLNNVSSSTFYFVTMNNNYINETLRQAISYTTDYNYIIEVIQGNQATRVQSIIPSGIRYSNYSLDYPLQNITEARRILVQAGLVNLDLDDDNAWLLKTANNPIIEINYTYNSGVNIRSKIGTLLRDNLAQIGIKLRLEEMEYQDYYYGLFSGSKEFQMTYAGWAPDYNDPSNYINPIFSNSSSANFCKVNDLYLENLMEQALTETNSSTRELLYDKIQKYVVEELMPMLLISSPINYNAFSSEVSYIDTNSMGNLWFYSAKGRRVVETFRIEINDLEGNNWEWASNQWWCSGSGTSEDPYVIEDLNINSYGEGYGIIIENSDKHFIIQNCTISNGGFTSANVKLINVSNGVISQNTIKSSAYMGLELEKCDQILINNNTITDNDIYALSLQYSDNCEIVHNTISDNYFGIFTYYSDDNAISENIIENNQELAILCYGFRNHFYLNQITENGFIIHPDVISSYSSDLIETSNLINGKPLYFYANETNLDNTNYSDAGQIILYNCSNSMIKGLNFFGKSISISLYDSYNILIDNNTFSRSFWPIFLVSSSNTTITHNKIYNSVMGIGLGFASSENLIEENKISNSSSYGVILENLSNNNTILNNDIFNCEVGIYLQSVNSNTITENMIKYSNTNGLYGQWSNDNLIYLNSFSGNELNAYMDQGENYWDNGEYGNYWDDYNGTDINDDGIGDILYQIPGETTDNDSYPILYLQFETNSGENVEVSDPITDVSLMFDEINENGTTTIASTTEEPTPETGFAAAGKYYDINTTASFSKNITIKIPYDENEISVNETDLKIMHYNKSSGKWIDITLWIDTENDIIYGLTESFSGFLIVQPDKAPPETKIYLDGELGGEEWYISDVMVTLTAMDLLSKIDYIEYSFDGNVWNTYSEPLIISTEGIQQIYYRSMDKAGNLDSIKNIIIKIDKTSPETEITIEGTLGMEEWYISPISIELNSIDELTDVNYIEYSFDGIVWKRYNGIFDLKIDDTFTIFYRAIDLAGNLESIKSEFIKIDKTAPTSNIVISGIEGENDWYLSAVAVSLDSSDHLSGLRSISFSFDNITWNEYSVPIEFDSDGTHTIYYRGTDNAGNIEEIRFSEIKIDRVNPESSVTLLGDVGTNNWFTSDVSIEISGFDEHSGISVLKYSYDLNSWFVYSEPILLSEEGETTIFYKAIDNSGHIGEINQILIKIDKILPETTISVDGILGNNDWFVSSISITLNGEDAISGIKMIEYRLNEGNWQVYDGTFDLSYEGINQIEIRSIDNAGNVGDIAIHELKIDYSTPSTELMITNCATDEDNNILVKYESDFILVSIDNHSGVMESYYRINGSEWISFENSFNLTGDIGTYLIEYYSEDFAGNCEDFKSTFVELIEETGDDFQGYGFLRINGQFYYGTSEMTLYEDTIEMNIEDQISTWDITNQIILGDLEIYTGDGDIGRITVFVYRDEDYSYMMAFGSGVWFIGYS